MVVVLLSTGKFDRLDFFDLDFLHKTYLTILNVALNLLDHEWL